MYSKNWEVIKDDVKKTFEVVAQNSSNNGFMNRVFAMQRAGMSVTALTPPVTNSASSKDKIKITGYTREDGLFDRLQKQLQEISRKEAEGWAEDLEE